MSTKTRRPPPPMTAGDHRANLLQKQLAGHQRLIAELQTALRQERARAWGAEIRADAAEMAFDYVCVVARTVLIENCRDSLGVACWMERFPGILGPREESTDAEV